MTPNLPSTDQSLIAPELSAAQKERIIDHLREQADEVISFHGSRNDEIHGIETTCYFGVFQRGNRWDVYSYAEGERTRSSLEFAETYSTYDEALARAREWAYATLEQAENDLNDQKDEAWAQNPDGAAELEGPFFFEDSTDFQQGWELDDEEEVFLFFKKHDYLLSPEEWGNLYSCSLLDANGTSCWVDRNHHGEMKLSVE